MMQELQKLFKDREINSFDAKDNKIMCFPHVINIAVQHVLSGMSKAQAPENNDDDPEGLTGVVNTD
jgi:hypothetical protein